MAARKSAKAKVPGRPRMAILSGPPADATCSLSRTVEVAGLRLEIWACSDPRPLIRVKMTAHRFPNRGHARLVARQPQCLVRRPLLPGRMDGARGVHPRKDPVRGL